MKNILLIQLMFSFLLCSCQTNNINVDEAIHARQSSFPSGQDKKWQAIKKLEISKEDYVCDSLYKIYLSIDTSIKGFGSYYDVIFNVLMEINSEKSAKTIEKIFSTKHPRFLSQSTYVRLSGAMSNSLFSGFPSHKNYELYFPGILNGLENDFMNAEWIIKLLDKGLNERKISKEQLVSYLPVLESFYRYTKIERDKPRPKDGIILDIYYWITNQELAKCLKTVNDNPVANNILLELFRDAKNANTTAEKELSWEAYKALDSIPFDNDYLMTICKDIGYRKKIYDYFTGINKFNFFPAAFRNQQSLCEMICVSPRNLRRHDTNKPSSVSYIGMKEIDNGLYYFYWICWWSTCESNSVVVVGPQPLDNTKFDYSPKLKGESIKENVAKSELQKIIAEYEPD
ncbi:hypothetical protein [Flavobacterium filum]|uniref:hypothetical protein n=1 Tax=Flavobacterium filum TaxID=370974 RepID=UPI0023F4A279|nr:hypothetical protein [Flavobacterium filum]